MDVKEKIDIFLVGIYLKSAERVFEEVERTDTVLEEACVGLEVKRRNIALTAVIISSLKHHFAINDSKAGFQIRMGNYNSFNCCLEFLRTIAPFQFEDVWNVVLEPIDKIVSEAVLDKTIPVLVKEKVEKSRKTAKAKGTQGLWIALAIIGFPIWFPLAITFGTLLFGIYLIIWILIICLFILLASIGAGALGGLILLPYGVIKGAIGWPAIFLGIGSFLFLGGLVVLLWKPICSCAVAFGKLAKRFVLSIKKLFV